jgi:hypothetical protein
MDNVAENDSSDKPPGLFIKNADSMLQYNKIYESLANIQILWTLSWGGAGWLLPFGQAILTTSASLQPVRGMQIQLHSLLLCRCSKYDL